jgi:hypothetical protein
LQILFAALQDLQSSFYDPTAFIQAINVSSGEQQDAQEFVKVAISHK